MRINSDLLVKNKTLGQIEDEATKIDTYSTNEIKTNKVWIDNKPIYRKVFKQKNFTSISTGILNADTIVEARCFVRNNHDTNNKQWRSIPSVINPISAYAEWVAGFYFNIKSGNVTFQVGSEINKLDCLVFIIEYTKTTD